MDPIDTPFGLDPAVAAAFARDGFIQLGGVFAPAELAPFAAAITDATLRFNTVTKPLEERTTYGKAFLQVMNLWERDDAARRFVVGKRLARIAADLLGVTSVRLYHDQSLYKEPGGGITPAHADQYYWPMASDRCVTAWVPLQAVEPEMGPLAFYRGSHTVDFGRDLEISDDSEREITARMEAAGFEEVSEPFALGDVSFHLGWTFHRAGPNNSARPRSVMTIIYMDAEMRLKAPANKNQLDDWNAWCPRVRIGDVIATPKNPVLY
jgi:ectoine hydroxylase-related dioxygenase (phytanoyl-CoA dioxygenase family)